MVDNKNIVEMLLDPSIDIDERTVFFGEFLGRYVAAARSMGAGVSMGRQTAYQQLMNVACSKDEKLRLKAAICARRPENAVIQPV